MFIREKYKPVFAPEMELGSDSDAGAPPIETDIEDTEVEQPETLSGKGKLRKQLESSFDAERKKDAKTSKGYVSRARQEGAVEAAEEGEPKTEGGEETEEQVTPPAPTGINPPEAWTKAAKAEWAKVPPAAQAAIAKREEDISRGVQALQSHYRDIDQVLGPRNELFKQYNQSPAQAVNRLFSWFDSLGANPDQAFPMLMKSFEYDPRRLIPMINQMLGQQSAQGQEQAQEGEVPAPVQQYVGQLENRIAQLQDAMTKKFGVLENTFAQQSQAKVQETLDMWSQNKPHFDKVRVMMGHLLESGQVPALQNGGADLDRAYDMALWAMPEVRQEIMAEMETKKAAKLEAKRVAERKAQKEAADKARRTGGSLAPSAPGSPVVAGTRKGPRKTVGESLREAIAEYRS